MTLTTWSRFSDVLGVDVAQRLVEEQLKVCGLGRGSHVANGRREHEMRDVGGTLRLVALIERLAGKLERLGEVEFPQRRAPKRLLDAVAVGVSENRIVRRDGLRDRMNRGVPSITRRLDRRIRLDRDFDELRLGQRNVCGMRERSDKCSCRERKHQSTADLYRWHPSSRPRVPMLYVAVTRIGYISRAGSAIDNH